MSALPDCRCRDWCGSYAPVASNSDGQHTADVQRDLFVTFKDLTTDESFGFRSRTI